MIDEQLISRLYTKPYNPVSSISDIITSYIICILKMNKSLNRTKQDEIEFTRTAIMYQFNDIDDDTFYLCYQAAVMSI